MALLVKYVRDTGVIVGLWESTEQVVLEAQRVQDDPVYGYLLCTEPLAARTVETLYQVVNGALLRRSSTSETTG